MIHLQKKNVQLAALGGLVLNISPRRRATILHYHVEKGGTRYLAPAIPVDPSAKREGRDEGPRRDGESQPFPTGGDDESGKMHEL